MAEVVNYKVVDSSQTTINSGNYMTLFVKKDGKYYKPKRHDYFRVTKLKGVITLLKC